MANNSVVLNSYSTSSVIFGGSYSWDNGGLVGTGSSSTINNSYSTGSVTGDEYVGGLIGESDSTINNSFSLSKVNGNKFVNGLIGNSGWNMINNLFWDINFSGKSNCHNDGNTGCNSTNNNISAYYGDSGLTKLGNDGNWIARENNFPILSWQVD
ncbi:MAG: hypothetical protein PHX27_04110 [Candidatus ainarchaeum sp.]|nr:hypothetical protein [Candidatus ainarchaeum sp.]